MTKTIVNLKVHLLIFIFLGAACLTATLLAYNREKGQIPDTLVRSRLMSLKDQDDRQGYVQTKSTLYSNILYDFEINKAMSAPLPMSSPLPPDPLGNYTFSWRLKLSYPALFHVDVNHNAKADYSFELTNQEGLPVYLKTNSIVLPDEKIELPAGIYLFKLTANKIPDFYNADFTPAYDTDVPASSADNNLKTIYLKLDGLAVMDFDRLINLARNTADEQQIVKMPKGRIKGLLVNKNGEKLANIRVGLSGRTLEHLAWHPSIDIKIKGGRVFMGVSAFKLYRLDTKTGLYDFAFLSILKDMGFPIPRQEILNLVVNGENMGPYLMTETYSPAMFTNQNRTEGDIVGVNPKYYFFNYPYGSTLEIKYFHVPKGPHTGKEQTRFFLSHDFAKKLEETSVATYIAFASMYLAAHGLGIDDLRFYKNPASNLFVPIPRDLNAGRFVLDYSLRSFLTHMAWWLNVPPYTVWPFKVLSGQKDDISPPIILTDIHFSLLQFVSAPENLQKANSYLYYFANNKPLRDKIKRRLVNALEIVLREHSENELLKTQLHDTLGKGVISFHGAVKHHIRKNALYFTDDDNQSYIWNIRTALSLDARLSPSFTAPLAADSRHSYTKLLALAFLCEKKIFSILEENNLTSLKKTFSRTESAEVPRDTINLPKANGKKMRDADAEGKHKEKTVNDVVIYLGMQHLGNNEVLLLFLVRNATDKAIDYSIKNKDGITSLRPVINRKFVIFERSGHKEASTIRQMMMNHFFGGEPLRLLAFKVALARNVLSYTMVLPENSHMLFPPYMYLPAASLSEPPSGKDITLPPEIIAKPGKGYSVPKGSRVYVRDDIVIPADKGLYVEEGVTFILSPGSSIKVSGDFHALGTRENPVRFLSEGNKPWGGLYISGNAFSNKTVAVMNHVEFDNFGQWPKTKVADLNLNGGITLYQVNTRLHNVRITNAKSEDAINLVHAIADIENVTILESFSDAIDLDFSHALINGVQVKKTGGDALDLSRSLIVCNNSTFEEARDKGISVGEMSNVFVSGSIILNNNMGIANKDQSFLHAENSLFKNNKTAFAEYIKKTYFGKPRSIMKNNTYQN